MTGKDGRRLEAMAEELEEMSSGYAPEGLTATDLLRCADVLRASRAAQRFTVSWLPPMRIHGPTI